uniref:nucleotide exchange factor GrpE n=1 Tax=Corynebacterium sp. TaxID=1720 RepID=UPI0037363283
GAEGEAFDPEIHEAVQDLSSGEDKVIGTVLRKGYRTGERLLRTAMVIIADPAADDA